MATNNLYRVTYHFESGGKKISDQCQDNVLAAGEDYGTIAAVLSGNGRNNGGHGTLVITSIGHFGGGALGILS